jgi:hypothetical protein
MWLLLHASLCFFYLGVVFLLLSDKMELIGDIYELVLAGERVFVGLVVHGAWPPS